MAITKTCLAIGVGLGLILTSSPATAVLGESQGAAAARARQWQARYGAVAPIFNTQDGKVVHECWSGPPEGWSQSTALAFAKALLPIDVREHTPEAVSDDDCTSAFTVPGGYSICLIGLGGVVYDVDVAVPTYEGLRC